MHTRELPPVRSSESHGNLLFIFLALIKFPGLKWSSKVLSTCAVCTYRPRFFPILSIRGSPQFKNGNETWLLDLGLLLASNHGNIIHTLHHRFS